MDPQTFLRLSVGSLGLRIPGRTSTKAGQGPALLTSVCLCEIRLRGFPVQTASVPLVYTSEFNLDPHTNAIVFSLEEPDLKALMMPGCFQAPRAYLEIVVYSGRQVGRCGVASRRRRIGVFRVAMGSEWRDGKPVLLHHGWTGIGKKQQKQQLQKEAGKCRPELHLRVMMEPDLRYVFQFEDETALSPQIVQLQGKLRQPIFSCKFIRDRRTSQMDPLGTHWSRSGGEMRDGERRERKGWKVMIHDLSGSAVAAAFMATPFVPSTGCDRVARSNPGAWLILRADPMCLSESWQPWGRLEAWRETASRDSTCLRLHLLPEGQDACVLVSEMLISSEKGGEFFIDMDRQTPFGVPIPNPDGITAPYCATTLGGCMAGGFVMNCKVQGEAKSGKPLVQLAMRYVMCVEDAAVFMALAAAVDLSIKACRPFRRKPKKGSPDSLET